MEQKGLKYGMLLIVCLFFIQTTLGQDSRSLKKRMLQKADRSYSTCVEEFGGEFGCNLIDDTPNGYLSIEGTFPPCGCGCIATVGAYKDAEGNYTLLGQEYMYCDWFREFSSDRELSAVLPEAFGIEDFIPHLEIKGGDFRYARFYIEAEIPRQGTDTKLIIKPIPFGLYIKSQKLLIYSIIEPREEEIINPEGSFKRSLEKTQYAARDGHLDPDLDLNNIPEKDLFSIDEIIVNYRINDMVNREKGDFDYHPPGGRRRMNLIELKHIYDLYSQIEHETIILGWDKEKARFYIKEKGERPKKVPFLEFLQYAEFWTGIC